MLWNLSTLALTKPNLSIMCNTLVPHGYVIGHNEHRQIKWLQSVEKLFNVVTRYLCWRLVGTIIVLLILCHLYRNPHQLIVVLLYHLYAKFAVRILFFSYKAWIPYTCQMRYDICMSIWQFKRKINICIRYQYLRVINIPLLSVYGE